MSSNESSIKTNYGNRFNRRIWLNDRRSDLIHYLQSRGINHDPLPPEPSWTVIPRSSIWLVRPFGSQSNGWFGVAGDHPTDIVSINSVNEDPREILIHFTNKWLAASEKLMKGEDYKEFRIQNIEQRESIGELINDRAQRIQRWVMDEYMWVQSASKFAQPSPLNDIDLSD